MKLTASFAVAILLTLAITAANSQTKRPPPPRSQYSPLAAQQGEHPVRQRRTWYEFALSRLNPDDFDYGTWMEERRRSFLEATLENQYFNYALAMTLVSLFLLAACAKIWNDGRRKDWVTAEMMTDLLNQDQRSQKVAKEAIRKYNEHIERCNRVIEAAESGRAIPGSTTEMELLQAKQDQTADELSAMTRDRDKLKAELDLQKALVTTLSLRTDAVSKMASAAGGISPEMQAVRTSSDTGSGTGRLMEHINNLETQLYAEKKKND